MFTTLWSLAQFDKNVLNLYVLKQRHPECKTKTELQTLSSYSKGTFFAEIKQLSKFEKAKKIDITSSELDDTLLSKLEHLYKIDKALSVLFLYLRERKQFHQFSTYEMAETCKISHNRIHKLMDLLVVDKSIVINKCERSFFDIDFIYADKNPNPVEISSKPVQISTEWTTDLSFDELLESVENMGNSALVGPETKSQIDEMKGLISSLGVMESDQDRNSLHTYLIKYINNMFKYLSNMYLSIIKLFKGKTSDQIEQTSPIKSEAVKTVPIDTSAIKPVHPSVKDSIPEGYLFGDESSWIDGIKKSISQFPSKFTSPKVTIQQEEGMKEDVLYVCNSWNSFASTEGVNLKKYRVPRKFAKSGIIEGGDTLLSAVTDWIQENPEDWKEMWDELLEYSKKNAFMKGTYKDNSWKPSLSWVFTIHPERGRNLKKILEGGYDFANDKPIPGTDVKVESNGFKAKVFKV
jgi:hypothetical protein